jgi:hypothetical protein
MMTLYIAFEAVKRGEISLDTRIRVSKNAAAEQPSKLGLKAGQRIKLRYCIRAAAVKSANDCATAIGEAISGSEAKFARRMNRTSAGIRRAPNFHSRLANGSPLYCPGQSGGETLPTMAAARTRSGSLAAQASAGAPPADQPMTPKLSTSR